jgi:hypothetical protein
MHAIGILEWSCSVTILHSKAIGGFVQWAVVVMGNFIARRLVIKSFLLKVLAQEDNFMAVIKLACLDCEALGFGK